MDVLLQSCRAQSIARARDYLFIDSILQDQPISPSFYDGLKAQEVIDAAKESYKMGQWVSP